MKTTIVIPDRLHHQLKVLAAYEQTDVSSLLCHLAAAYVEKKKPLTIADVIRPHVKLAQRMKKTQAKKEGK
jgi:hypothetical protein